MHIVKKMAPAAVLLAAVFLLTACPSQTTISRINADPGRYRGKEVGVIGTVTDSYGVLGNGAYEVDDGTGRIWVATRRGVPSRGSRVAPLSQRASAPGKSRPPGMPSNAPASQLSSSSMRRLL